MEQSSRIGLSRLWGWAVNAVNAAACREDSLGVSEKGGDGISDSRLRGLQMCCAGCTVADALSAAGIRPCAVHENSMKKA
jgi:hypothetical protein